MLTPEITLPSVSPFITFFPSSEHISIMYCTNQKEICTSFEKKIIVCLDMSCSCVTHAFVDMPSPFFRHVWPGWELCWDRTGEDPKACQKSLPHSSPARHSSYKWFLSVHMHMHRQIPLLHQPGDPTGMSSACWPHSYRLHYYFEVKSCPRMNKGW